MCHNLRGNAPQFSTLQNPSTNEEEIIPLRNDEQRNHPSHD